MLVLYGPGLIGHTKEEEGGSFLRTVQEVLYGEEEEEEEDRAVHCSGGGMGAQAVRWGG